MSKQEEGKMMDNREAKSKGIPKEKGKRTIKGKVRGNILQRNKQRYILSKYDHYPSLITTFFQKKPFGKATIILLNNTRLFILTFQKFILNEFFVFSCECHWYFVS